MSIPNASNKELVKALIEEVQKKRRIWFEGHAKFNNNNARSSFFKQVSITLNHRFNTNFKGLSKKCNRVTPLDSLMCHSILLYHPTVIVFRYFKNNTNGTCNGIAPN